VWQWLEEARAEGIDVVTHLLIVCDTFPDPHEAYPHAVGPDEDVQEVAREMYGYPGERNMQRVVECYDMRMPIEDQLNEFRALHFT